MVTKKKNQIIPVNPINVNYTPVQVVKIDDYPDEGIRYAKFYRIVKSDGTIELKQQQVYMVHFHYYFAGAGTLPTISFDLPTGKKFYISDIDANFRNSAGRGYINIWTPMITTSSSDDKTIHALYCGGDSVDHYINISLTTRFTNYAWRKINIDSYESVYSVNEPGLYTLTNWGAGDFVNITLIGWLED
jgi:hypothetical protein